jgi:hypothetical protein
LRTGPRPAGRRRPPDGEVSLDEFGGRGEIRISDHEVIEQLLLVLEQRHGAGRVAAAEFELAQSRRGPDLMQPGAHGPG